MRKTPPAENKQDVVCVVECIEGIPGRRHRKVGSEHWNTKHTKSGHQNGRALRSSLAKKKKAAPNALSMNIAREANDQ